jgi:thiol:disulfide interchange protein DsbD
MRAAVSRDGVAPGGHIKLAVVYDVPADAHIQVNDFLFAEPATGEPFKIGGRVLPRTKLWDGDPVIAGRAVVVYDLEALTNAPLGDHTLKLRAGYQACTEKPIYACYGPVEGDLTVGIKIVATGTSTHPINPTIFIQTRMQPGMGTGTQSAVEPAPNGSATPSNQVNGASAANTTEPWLADASADTAGSPSIGAAPVTPPSPAAPGGGGGTEPKGGLQDSLAGKLRGALAKGSFIAFVLVFIAGFLTSFTPCVYPMIPITIGFVLGASRGRFSGFILSLFFVIGIAIVYSTLGLIAALGGIVFGAALQSPIALVVVAAVFLAMGISMMGAFNISLPSGFQTKLQSRRQGGWIGAVIMGGVTGLVASPCVGPVLVVILTWVAQVGRPLYGFTLLLTFAFGLGLLFLVLGTFVGALPRGGAWMDSVKHVFGWIFFVLAIFYVRTLLGPNVTTIAMGITLILMATQIGAFSPLSAESEKGERWRKGIGIVIAVFGIAMMGHGLLSHYGWRTQVGTIASVGPASPARSSLAWRNDESRALEEARTSGRPILIDFTADWCAACHELDRDTWSDPAVQKELSRFVTLRFDMTSRNETTSSLGDRWKVRGLPTVIVIDGKGNEVTRFFGFRPPAEVLPILVRA